MSAGGPLDGSDFLFEQTSASRAATPPAEATLEDMERNHIQRTLERARWVIEGAQGAARKLGLNPSTLRGRMRKLGIRKH